MTHTYSILREFADSWALIALTATFVGVILWAFRPGSRTIHDAAAASILRDETPRGIAACPNACPDCTCASLLEKLR